NRNTACGKYKEEMLSQLRDMMKLESCFINDLENLESLLGFEPLVPELNLELGTISTGFEHQTQSTTFPTYEKNEKWEGDFGDGAVHVPFKSTYTRSYGEQNSSVLNKTNKTDVACDGADPSCDHDNNLSHHVVRGTPSIPPKVVLHKSVILNRGESLSRYKEKRKTRR
ncbi:hypothetical protein, partial [Ralstonia pseudosolanacearum]|uniref:hypothetical protein n=1 Tax=Ralstonia pseudosolanacearum TaxID=1310165 RepID=UPI003CEA28DA